MRAALGSCHRIKQTMPEEHRPPDAPDGKPMDSALAETRSTGGCVDHGFWMDFQVFLVCYNPARPVFIWVN